MSFLFYFQDHIDFKLISNFSLSIIEVEHLHIVDNLI
jgi:hypothetical protein